IQGVGSPTFSGSPRCAIARRETGVSRRATRAPRDDGAAMADLALSIALGVALAAATGFRVFLPMLIVGGAAHTGYLHLGDGFAWLGTPPALTMLGVAALVEVLAYYIPIIDNVLDVAAAPAAFIAGTILSAAVMTGMLRAHSTVLTGGLGNFVISTAELGGAVLISFLALAAPVAAIALVVLFLLTTTRLIRRLLRGAKSSGGPA